MVTAIVPAGPALVHSWREGLRVLLYRDGSQVHVGDHVVHATAAAVVEDVIEGDEVANLGLEEPGFLLMCDQCGRVLINPGSADWEDVAFVRRRA